MKKFILVLLTLIAIFFSGCGETPGFVPGDPNNEVNNSSVETRKVVFHVGEEKTSNKMQRSISVKKEDFLDNVQSVCLQVFIKGEYTPVYGQCQSVINKKYPIIEVDYEKLPTENFKAKLVGYLYENTDWQNTSNILVTTNEKVFDGLLVGIGVQDIYMGDLYAVDSVKVSLYVSDSSQQTDFSDFQKVTLITENGRKIEYQSDYESKSTDYKWSEFWIEKDQSYKMLCLDSECYYIYPEFDFFKSDSFDLSKAEKVEMVQISSGDVCSIKYNEDFHQTLGINGDDYPYFHWVEVSDCNIEDYEYKITLPQYEGLSLSFNGKSILKSVNEDYVLQGDLSKYFDIAYYYQDEMALNQSFSPFIYIEIIDKKNGEIVQKEVFDLTSFEFVESKEIECDETLEALGLCTLNKEEVK